ncbi:unnamed protein product [Gadus morhua 'NCC']
MELDVELEVEQCHPPPKQQGRYSEPPFSSTPSGGTLGASQDYATSSSSDGAHGRRFRRKSAGINDRPHAKQPPLTPRHTAGEVLLTLPGETAPGQGQRCQWQEGPGGRGGGGQQGEGEPPAALPEACAEASPSVRLVRNQ